MNRFFSFLLAVSLVFALLAAPVNATPESYSVSLGEDGFYVMTVTISSYKKEKEYRYSYNIQFDSTGHARCYGYLEDPSKWAQGMNSWVWDIMMAERPENRSSSEISRAASEARSSIRDYMKGVCGYTKEPDKEP